MSKIKIVVTRSLLGKDLNYIRDGLEKKVGKTFELITPDEFNEEGICACLDDADILLGPFVTHKMLEKGKNIKLIQIPWTGMDTFNFEVMKDFDIPVCNTHSNADVVAELGVALTLDILKKTVFHDRKMRDGDWNRKEETINLKSRLVSKQVICIYGYGNIGRRMARIFSGFGTTVIAIDNYEVNDDIVKEIYHSDCKENAIKKADVIISTLPLTNETRYIFDDEFITYMKDDVIIINMSRANVMKESAIFTGLSTGKIGGFASDVWWNTPKRGESKSYPSTENEFWKMDNVVMSPHRAGFVEEILPHLDEAIINLTNFITGKSLINIVDIDKTF